MGRLIIICVALLSCCVLTQGKTKGILLPLLRELLKETRQSGTCGTNQFSNQEWDLTLPAGGAGGGGNQYGSGPPQYGSGPPQQPPAPGQPGQPGEWPPIHIQVECNVCDESGNCFEADPSMCPDMTDFGFKRSRGTSKGSSSAYSKLLRSLGLHLQVTERVTGGREVTAATFPFVVYVQAGPYQCGGVLVGPSKVITAAHCIEMKEKNILVSAQEITVKLGEHNIQQTEAGEVSRGVARVVVNPKWNGRAGGLKNDIAILILDSPVSYSATIQPACMPPYGAQIPYGQTCVGVGWGFNTQIGSSTAVLTAINLVIQNPQNSLECLMASEDQICTKALGGKGDVCQGDSGGPLLCKNSADAWEVLGIVSNGPKCFDLNGPGFWANVIYFKSWIDSIN